MLTDFGLARDVNDSLGLTESGAVMGTPWYMSPEQTRGEVRAIDHRSDIYSLGATLYELISGRPPFHSETTVDALIDGMLREPPLLSTQVAGLPKGLDIIVSKCLNKEPDQRYGTAQELAEDLARVIQRQPVRATRLGLWHRLRWRARHNRPAAVALAALLLSLLGAVGYVVHSQLLRLRQERQARELADLSRSMGQEIATLEFMARLAYAMPLHDAGRELALVQSRMTKLEHDLQSAGALGAGLGHYALGRGYMALHDWAQAAAHLQKAESSVPSDPELHYALGRVLGALYSDGIEAARKSGDASFVATRRAELARDLLTPALQHLERSRAGKAMGTAYLEGLIAYYHGHYEAVLGHARRAQEELPWGYEAAKLAGDAHVARGLEHKDRGDYGSAAQSFEQALWQYSQASELGRSDYQVHEAIAEVVVRQMELDGLRDLQSEARLIQAIQAADRAVTADPVRSHGEMKKAFAYLFRNMQMEARGIRADREPILQALLKAGKLAVMRHPTDEYAHEVLGSGYVCMARFRSEQGQGMAADLAAAREHLSRAITIHARFPWAYNELGSSYLIEGDDGLSRHRDPTGEYTNALVGFQRAIEVDRKYVNAYANAALASSGLARWHTELGQAPDAWLQQTQTWADRAAELDPTMLLPRGALIFAYIMKVLHEGDAGHDIQATLKQALSLVDDASRRYGDNPVLAQHAAILRYLEFRQQRSPPSDPSLAGRVALDAIGQCNRRMEGGDATCTALEALLNVQRAEWARAQRLPWIDLDRRAESLARQALRTTGSDTDVRMAVAEASWRLARLRRSLGLEVSAVLGLGRAAADEILARAPGWPRALALRGGMDALAAAAARSADDRQRALASAQDRLRRAERGNPLLRQVYPGAYADAGLAGGSVPAATSPRD